jgi:Photosynthetic reaction centre cytochrome C subunit
MSPKHSSIRMAGAVAFVLLAAFSVAAQQPQAKTAGEQFKNIKVLNDMPAAQLNIGMHLIEGALGVECEHCHFEPDFAKDGKETKETARKMITMVQNINKNTFDGRQVVTCYTCHHGSAIPTGLVALPDTLVGVVPYGTEKQTPTLPSVDQILTKYIEALGGEKAIRGVTSRVMTTLRTIPSGPGGAFALPATGEQYQKAPNFYLSIAHGATSTTAEGFDGTSLWAQNANGVVANSPEPDNSRTKRGVDLQESLKLKQAYTKMEVTKIDRVGAREAYVVVGNPQGDLPERLYFDTRSGLLLRKATELPAGPFGTMPYEVDYDDYRTTNSGVKIPFWIRSIPANGREAFASYTSIRIQKVDDNVAVDNAKFTKPASKPVPAPGGAPGQ